MKSSFLHIFFYALLIAALACATSLLGFVKVKADNVNTHIYVAICGDGVVMEGEVCDDGDPNNTGAYGFSIAERHCKPACDGFGPYCGDAILQPLYEEECDDGNNDPNDFCSAICEEEPYSSGGGSTPRGDIPTIPGGQAGNISAVPSTKLVIKGKAFPNSDVNILSDGVIVTTVKADINADFSYSTTELTSGVSTFSFWGEDKNKLKSVTITVTLEVIQNAITTIAGILLPPTIQLSKDQLSPGEFLKISGQSIPSAKIFAHMNSEPEMVVETATGESGDWALQLDTASLRQNVAYLAKAYFESGKIEEGTIQSPFSKAMSFNVGEGGAPTVASADFNGDQRVNIMDFSIFLVNWGTTNDRCDLNRDGRVNVSDFSILLVQWTG